MARPRKSNTHLPKSLYEKRGKYVYVTTGADGKQRSITLGSDLNEALAEYDKLTGATKQPIGALDEKIDAALKIVNTGGCPGQKKALSKKTIQVYACYVKVIKRGLREFTDLRKIKGTDISDLKIATLEKHGQVAANIVLSILRNMFALWQETGVVDTDVAAGVKMFPTTRRDRLITADEFRSLYEHADDWMRAILNLWRITAQRVMDVAGLKRSDIREDGLHVLQKKTKTPITIGWNPALRAAVEQAKALNKGVATDCLFFVRSKRGPTKGRIIAIPEGTLWSRFKVLRDAAGITDVQQRDFRAVGITAAAQQMGVEAAQKLAGHKDRRTTERYIRDHGVTVEVVRAPSFGQVLDIQKTRQSKQ